MSGPKVQRLPGESEQHARERLEWEKDGPFGARPKPSREDCPNCVGTGQAVPGCETCKGNGWVYDDEDGGTKVCPECHDERCDACED